MYTTKAKVTVKNAQNAVVGEQVYDKIVFHGIGAGSDGKPTIGTDPNATSELLSAAIGKLQTLNPKGNAVVDLLEYVTYAYDLGVRNSIRQGIVNSLAGPDKAIDKAVKDYMTARQAMGKPVTEEVARRKVMED